MTPRRISIFLAVLITNLLFATNYYVSPSGSNSNSGLSAGNAWRTIAKVQSAINLFGPGDQILFERGGTYRGFLSIQCSGTPGNPVVFGAYGSGPLPIISGSAEVSGWTAHTGNIWKSPTTGDINKKDLEDQIKKLIHHQN